MGDFYNRDKMWFGTLEYQTWVETPQSGADVSPSGFGTSATNLLGGGYVRNSVDSHKVYQFSWGSSADLALASLIHAFRDGTYGRGLLYFHDPMYYGMNILPKRWADPSMALNYEATPLIAGVWPTSTPTGPNPNGLPVQTAIYNVPAGHDSSVSGDELYLPIPPGFTLTLGMVFSAEAAGVRPYWRPQNSPEKTPLAPLGKSATTLLPVVIPANSTPGIYLGVRNLDATSRTLSISGAMARLAPPGEVVNQRGPWTSGHGHSGCEFRGSPTLINYNGVNGGQVGLACTLMETGAWK